MKKFYPIMFLFLFVFLPLQAQANRSIAFLNIENVNGDPQYDYLEGIIRGILLFDLGAEEEIILVVRSQLDAVLAEQKLAMTGLIGNEAVQVGELVGADYLISGEYIFLGEEVMVNLALIDVESGQSIAYRSRGNTENFIHGMAEELIKDILGHHRNIQDSTGERSILSLKDVASGTLYLYSYLIEAEIYLDGNFIGYTTGNKQDPFILEELKPGDHTLSIQLPWFGVVEKPEFTFHPYEEIITIEAGKRLTLRPDIRHYNSWINEARNLLDYYISYREMESDRDLAFEESFSFIDREGELVEISLRGILNSGENKKLMDLLCTYNGTSYPIRLERTEGTYKETKETLNKIDISLEISNSRFTIKVNRNDIWNGMFW